MLPILDQTIDSLLDRSFTVSFFNGALISRKNKLFCIYLQDLCGKIYFDNEGNLKLNCYYKFKSLDYSQAYYDLLKNYYNCIDFSEINPAEEFLYLNFMINGDKWITSPFILTNFNIKGEGIEIDVSIARVMYTGYRELNEGVYRAIIPIESKIFIPLNKVEYYDRGGFSYNECEFSIKSITFNIKKEKKYYLLSIITSENEDINRISNIFKEAFNIYQGQEVLYLIETKIINGTEFKVINSQSSTYKNPLSIFRTINDEWGLNNLRDFIKSYTHFNTQPHSEMYEWWRKINDVTNNIFEVKALIISVAIEGLINEYYKYINTKTCEYIDILAVNKKLLEKQKSVFDSFIYERLASSLGYMAKDTSSTKLTYLYNRRLINKNLLKNWKDLRNPLAHGNYPTVTNGSYEEIAIHQKKLFTCLELFYRLIFIKIGYSGHFKQLSDSTLSLDSYQFFYLYENKNYVFIPN